jgi:hypothetical protein
MKQEHFYSTTFHIPNRWQQAEKITNEKQNTDFITDFIIYQLALVRTQKKMSYMLSIQFQ